MHRNSHLKSMQYSKLRENISSYFRGNDRLSKKELVCEIRKNFPNLADNTINVYISKLKKEGFLYTPSRGVYKTGSTKPFQPFISHFLQQIYNKIKNSFPYINFCVAETAWLNDFMIHQPFRNYTYIEIEKDAIESVFNFLNKQSKIKPFLYSDKNLFDRYLNDSTDILIVKNLVSEAPLTVVNNTTIPSLEKLLVDMLTDVELFSPQQSEKEVIIQNVINTYTINQSKLQRYAQRRNRKEELNNLINILSAN